MNIGPLAVSRTALAVLATALLAPAADNALLQLIAKDPKVVAGMDVDRARNSAFGNKVLGEFKEEDEGFQKFLDATGFDPRRDMREILMVSDGGTKHESTLILVKGLFNTPKIAAFLRAEGKASSLYQGVEIWSDGKEENRKGAMAFLNSSTALFGNADMLRSAIDRSKSTTPGISPLLNNRIADWSAKSDAWFITTVPISEAGVGKSGSNQVMPQGLSVDAVREAAAGVKFGSDLQIAGEAVARSEKDAIALGDVLRFFASMVRLNADKPGMDSAIRIADSLQVSTSGNTMRFSLKVPESEWNKIIDGKPGKSQTRTAKRNAPEVI